MKTTHEKKEHIVSTCCLPHSIFSQRHNTQSKIPLTGVVTNINY